MLSLFLASLALGHLSAVKAQSTSAICLPTYDWMFNSLGQSPCLTAAWLHTPCYPRSVSIVGALLPGYYYRGPQSTTDPGNHCLCNTVIYSMLAACAVCQGEGLAIYPWPTYATNCTSYDLRQYPEPIPIGTRVPAWAYLDVTVDSNFDVSAAMAAAAQNLPESTSPAQNTAPPQTEPSGFAPSATNTFDETNSGGVTPTSAVTPSPAHHVNIVPIVAGVVGGVGGILVLGAGLFFLLRHNNKNRNEKGSLMTSQNPGVVASVFSDSDQKPSDGPGVDSVLYSGTPSPSPGSKADYAPKVYDPNDPRTFPTHTMVSMPGYGDTQQVPSVHPSHGYSTSPSFAGSGNASSTAHATFTGRPEV